MREIKFRFWDKVNQQMRYMGLNSVIGWERASLDIMMLTKGTPLKRQLDKCIYLQQYTGLQDKLGKEIYEGDIVRELTALITGDGFAPLSGKHPVFEVKYCIGRKDRPVNPLYGDVGYNISSGSCYEVIGNIYESPELLENTKT